MPYSMSRNPVPVTGFGTVRGAGRMAAGLRAAFGPATAVRVGEGLVTCGGLLVTHPELFPFAEGEVVICHPGDATVAGSAGHDGTGGGR